MVNKEVMIPLRSPPGLDFTILVFLIGLWPMYYFLSFSTLITTVKFLYFV